jgi:hypothetical protein
MAVRPVGVKERLTLPVAGETTASSLRPKATRLCSAHMLRANSSNTFSWRADGDRRDEMRQLMRVLSGNGCRRPWLPRSSSMSLLAGAGHCTPFDPGCQRGATDLTKRRQHSGAVWPAQV